MGAQRREEYQEGVADPEYGVGFIKCESVT
jgi:hypothetical protein